jgi:hypothetical protein
MSACPSRVELSLWESRPEPERPAEFVAHVQGCGRCSAVLDDISSARSLLLGAYPAEASARAARTIMDEVQQRRARRRWLRFLAPVFLVPAAAALLLIVRPALHSHGQGDSSSGTSFKGGLIVETYCKRGDKVFPAVDGSEFLAGDRLRFAYSSDRPGFLLVFGVDDQGKVFPYYEEHGLVGVGVEAGAHVFLPGAVELDSHQGWERVFALWAETQFADDVVRAAVGAALSAAASDLHRMTALDLPVQQVSMLLRRP